MKLPENLKILLVEDSQINQRMTALLFKTLGLNCDIATNGKEAFEMYRQKLYDMVLMDMYMPVMDGIESTRKIREFEKDLGLHHKAFIVALTGSELHEIKNASIEAGIDEFMGKPISTERMHKTISLKFK